MKSSSIFYSMLQEIRALLMEYNMDFLRYTYFPTNIPATKDLKKISKKINLGLLFNRVAATSTTSDLLIYRLRIV